MVTSGQTIGRYLLVAELGAGGMGRVFVAQDTLLERRVALKVLLSEAIPLAARPEWSARMLREARAAAALHHPNVVSVFDAGEHEGAPFLVMELVDGRPLRDYVGRTDVAIGTKLRWLWQVATALATAHSARIIHRDVKPDNVMVTASGDAKILDFGIARRPAEAGDPTAATEAPGAAALTAAGTVIGTTRYMAPEQIRAEPLDGRADQFSWGLVAYELLSGSLPWGQGDVLQVVAAILTEPAPPLSGSVIGVPPAVASVVARALAKRRDERFATMDEIATALSSLVAAATPTGAEPAAAIATDPTVPIATPPPMGRKPPSTTTATVVDEGSTVVEPPRTRTWPRVAAAAIVVTVAVGATGVALHRTQRPAPTPAAATSAAPVRLVRLAIPPFENASRDPADDWLRVGLAEALSTKLSVVDGVHVSRIQASEGVAPGVALIRGSFQKAGDQIRIVVGVDGNDTMVVEQRGGMATLFELQDALAIGVADKLRGSATAAKAAAAVRGKGTRNLDAFRAYAKGLALLEAKKYAAAMVELRNALELDPQYSAAKIAGPSPNEQSERYAYSANGACVVRRVKYIPKGDSPEVVGINSSDPKYVTRAWDTAGVPLAVAKNQRNDHFAEFRISYPKEVGKPPRHLELAIELESECSAAPSADGLFVRYGVHSTDPGGALTLVLQTLSPAVLLTAAPMPVERTTDRDGASVLLRETRDAESSYFYGAVFAADPGTADRYQRASVDERAAWIQRVLPKSPGKRVRFLAQAAEPMNACELAKRGNVDEARALVGRIGSSREAYGPFFVAWTRACLARAEGDAATALRELETAANADDIDDSMVPEVTLEAIDVAEEVADGATMARIARVPLARAGWWEPAMFERDLPAGDTERTLVLRHEREPTNDAVRYDLALFRLQRGDADGAAEMVKGREESTAEIYVVDMLARAAIAKGDVGGGARWLRRLATLYPLGYAWRWHAMTLAEAGRGDDAFAFFMSKMPAAEHVFLADTLGRIAAALPSPGKTKDALIAFLRTVPESDDSGVVRARVLARVVAGLDTNHSNERADLARALVAELREATARGCDKTCMSRLAKDVCQVGDLDSRDRAWLASASGGPCKRETR